MIGYKLDFSRAQKDKGWSDSELARRMDISRSTMGYLKVRNGIDFEMLARLCRVLEVEPKDILIKYEIKG